MAIPTDGDDTIFWRAVRETLDSIVTPTVRDALIHDALVLAGLDEFPEDARQVRAFASGPLRSVAEEALGVELARSVAEEILVTIKPWFDSAPPTHRGHGSAPSPWYAPLDSRPPPSPNWRPTPPPATPRVSQPPTTPRVSTPTPAADGRWSRGAGSHVRNSGVRSSRDEPPHGMIPVTSNAGSRRPALEQPVILLATEDTVLFQTLAESFSGRARVCRIRSASDLVRQIDGARGQRILAVLDGKAPSIRPAAMVVLLEDQRHVDVVLCRAAPATEQAVFAASTATEHWLVYGEPASLEHIVAECLRLVS